MGRTSSRSSSATHRQQHDPRRVHVPGHAHGHRRRHRHGLRSTAERPRPGEPCWSCPRPARTSTWNLDGGGPGGHAVQGFAAIFRLNIGAGGRATVASDGDRVLTMNELFVSAGGTLDITDNAAVIDHAGGGGTIADVQARVTSGYNGGAWNGTGISRVNRRRANGHRRGLRRVSEMFTSFPATFAGQSVDATAVLLRHTFYGDANLDRAVEPAGLQPPGRQLRAGERRWSQGDFNFDRDGEPGGLQPAGGKLRRDDAAVERRRRRLQRPSQPRRTSITRGRALD